MDHTQGLRNGYPGLVLSQPIQSLDDCLDLAFPQQLLRELLCGTLSHGRCICDNALTEPALLDLLSRQGKNRQQFNHYLDDDIGHYRSRRDRRIDLKALEKVSQALKEIK